MINIKKRLNMLKLKIKISIIAISYFFSISSILQASPLIENITKSDSQYYLSGTSFRNKSRIPPLLWDNFEGGSNGTPLSQSANWTAYQSDGGYYNNTQAYSGSLSAYNYVNSEGGAYGGFNTSYHSFTATDQVYITYIFRYDGTGSKYGVGKMSRITSSPNAGGGGVYHGTGDTGFSNLNFYYGGSGYLHYNNSSGETQVGYVSTGENIWLRAEMYKKLSTAGESDGKIFLNVIGKGTKSDLSAMTRAAGETFQLDTVLLGLMYANIGNFGGAASMKMWIDDVYIDNTQARVELGNNPVFANCTHREIQIPTAWSDTEITVQFNQGTFQVGDQAYLFVIDEDGNASAGYPIVIGESSDAQAEDVNQDGVVDVNDVNLTVRQVIAEDPPNPRADVNENGSIDVLDVQQVVNAVE
jgi:hypothetical protein